MALAFIVLVGLFIVGPTLYILNTFTNGLGNYIANFFSMSLRIPSSQQNSNGYKIGQSFIGLGGYPGRRL